MSDLLVRLYDLPEFPAEARVRAAGFTIRRAIPPERHVVVDWILAHFGEGWASEAETAFSQLPVTLWVATRDNVLLGFACHDATAKGFFGPTGVAQAARGQGLGEALLAAALRGMREAGYAYGVIGDPGPVEFYVKRLQALEIPGSDPGYYRGMLRRQHNPLGQPWSGGAVSTGYGQETKPMSQDDHKQPKPDGAVAYRDGKKPGPASADVQVRESGPDAQRNKPKQWDKADEESDESFPASDPPANY